MSLVLMLALLLGTFTVFAQAAGAESTEKGTTAGASSTVSYLDLYVKDGLVALFDGFSVTASAQAPTEWAPVNLYGKDGYDSYIDPSRYTYALESTGTGVAWSAIDGGYKRVFTAANSTKATYLNLNSLGAILGTDAVWSVQEISSHTQAPIVQDGVLTNYSRFPQGYAPASWLTAQIGSLKLGGTQTTGAKHDGVNNVVGVVMQYLDFAGQYKGHITYRNADNGATYYDSLVGDDGTDLSGYYVGSPITIDRTVIRFPATEAMNEKGETTYTSLFSTIYAPVPSARSGNNNWSTTSTIRASSANRVEHYATTLRVAADGDVTRSVRIYDRELTALDVSANHLADLAGFYQLDSGIVSEILSLSENELKALYEKTNEIEIIATGRDASVGSAYMMEKTELLLALGYEVEDDDDAFYADYVSLYVKDGLVALFDAHSATASSAAVTKWTPAALYGKTGYDDYFNPSTYTSNLAGVWYWDNGGLRSSTSGKPYLNLDSLGAILGTVYTVQEVLSYPLITPQIENGIFKNNSSYVTFGSYVSGAVGPFLYGALNNPNQSANVTGYATPLHNMLFGQFCFGTSSKYDYVSHVYYDVNYGAVKYGTLKDSSGKDYAGYTIGGGTTYIEQSIARLGVKETVSDSATTYASTFKLHYQFAPTIRSFGPLSATGMVNDTTGVFNESKYYNTDRSVHYSTTLRLAAGNATYHAIRIYNRELTASEYNQNHLVDLAAHLGISLAEYANLNAEKKVIVANVMAGYSLKSDKEAVKTALAETIKLSDVESTLSDTLYVTDGLTVLLTAYEGHSTPYAAVGNNTVNWINAVDEATYGTLKGTGWKKNASGGFTIVKTIDDYNGTRPENVTIGTYAFYTPKEQYGLELDGKKHLPEGSFTVELVSNPVGITDKNGDRWIDTYSKYGTYIENGMAIGPLRALQFSCIHASSGGGFSRRWNYGVGDTPYNDYGGKGIFNDTYWVGLEEDEVTIFTVSMEAGEERNSYALYGDGRITNFFREKDEIISNADAGYMFRLMNGVAGTIYAVRVYDRVLSEAERAQNRMADLVYYYGIDATLIAEVIHAVNKPIESLVDAFADVDFDMDKAEAQELLTRRLTAIWLTESGYAVRGDLTDGLRYYFSINEQALRLVAQAGYAVELGSIINVGKTSQPVLNGNAYDYKVVAYDSTMGKIAALFVDEDTYTVTVRYENADKAALTTSVKAVGYIKLTDAYGNETVYYTEGTGPDGLFESYHLIDKEENDAITENAALSTFIDNRIASSYNNSYIYLDGTAASGGNGSQSAPYRDFATAFTAAKKFLRGVSVPTNLYLVMSDGRYSITETQELLATDKPYEYSTFTLTSESGNAVLTTTVGFDASKFTYEGDNIYSYQFEADASGNYPAFRSLYVNDSLAEIATNGSSHAADRADDLYVTAFDRTITGAEYIARGLRTQIGSDFTYMYAPYVGRADLEEEFAYYRDMYIAYNDVLALSTSNAAQLVYGMTPTRTTDSAGYKAGFNQFVIQFMAAYDVRQMIASNGWTGNNLWKPTVQKTKADFGGNATDFSTYSAAFLEARNAMATAGSATMAYTDFEAITREDVRNTDKMYMPEAMVGDLTSLIEPGRQYMVEYAAKLLASATNNSELKTAQDLSKAVNDEYLWRRHCLTPYEIELHHTCQWNYNIVHLAGIDYADYIEITNDAGVKEKHIAIYMKHSEYSVFQINAGYSTAKRYVHMKNAYQYLDENNEYLYDEDTGKLYYYSSTAVSGYDFEYATLDNMFIIKNVDNIVFDNVQFTGTDDYYLSKNGYMGGLSGMQPAYYGIWGEQSTFPDRAALYLMNCSSVTIKNCRFYDLSCEGVDVTGWSENYLIDGNTFENIGSSAIRMGVNKTGRDDGYGVSWFEGFTGHRNITVTNNYLHNIATEYYVTAVLITKVENAVVRYNTLTDCTYTGITIGWDWGNVNYDVFDHDLKVNCRNVDISYNYVKNFMTEMGDGGAIYMPIWNGADDNADFYMNTVHHNTIVFTDKTGDGLGNMVVGLYFDASSSNWYCSENVIVEQSYGAISSETSYSSYGITAEDAALKQKRRTGSDYIYLQYIDDQETHNIYVEGNYVLNARGTSESACKTEVYGQSFTQKDAPSRNLVESGTQYIRGVASIPKVAEDIITACGATGHKGELALIKSNNY